MRVQRFYRCEHCGNLVGLISEPGVPLSCCGDEMGELTPKTTETGSEKHLPVVSRDGAAVRVKIGSAAHPMEEGHRISFVYLETENGGQRRVLKGTPEAAFALLDDTPVAVYAYCNQHGLWKTAL